MKYLFLLFLFTKLISLNLYAITLGIVPQQSPLKLMKVWMPVVKYLEKETGERVTLKLERSIPSFEKELYNGFYDIAYMNPYHYIVANKKQGYLAMVRANKKIVGILVTNKNSGISDVSMTKDKIFLFPAPNAFAATLLIKYELLKEYNIDINTNERFLYVNSHDSVYKGVARRIGDVGGGIMRTFNNLADKKSKKLLTVLYKTKSYPSHPFAYKSSMPKEISSKFTKAFLNMPKKLLDSLSMKKIIKTNDKEYDVVRDLSQVLHLESKE